MVTENSNPLPFRAATVGTFDGFHRGHGIVIDTLREEASLRGLSPLIVTLDRHPLETVSPERAPRLISSPQERIDTLRATGMEVEVAEFNRSTAGLTAEDWMKLLRDKYRVRLLVTGYDNTFGCDGRLFAHSHYRELGERLGVTVTEAPERHGISSSAIRRSLMEGDIAGANEMLGRDYSLSGTVVSGRHMGRKIGFPTANIDPGYRACLPKEGVYKAVALTEEGRKFRAVVNIGHCPTLTDGTRKSIEAHLLDFDGDLYGRRLTLNFTGRIRGERQFEGAEELRRQIEADAETART